MFGESYTFHMYFCTDSATYRPCCGQVSWLSWYKRNHSVTSISLPLKHKTPQSNTSLLQWVIFLLLLFSPNLYHLSWGIKNYIYIYIYKRTINKPPNVSSYEFKVYLHAHFSDRVGHHACSPKWAKIQSEKFHHFFCTKDKIHRTNYCWYLKLYVLKNKVLLVFLFVYIVIALWSYKHHY